jgi:hypothetical protein
MTNTLKNFTDDDLKKELERRAAQKPIMPSPLVHPNFDVLRKEVVDYLKWLRSDEYDQNLTDKFATSIFEAAINSFYDVSIWNSYIMPIMEMGISEDE